MSIWEHYHIAKSADEALQALSEAQGKAQIIAGGTDLLIDIQQGRHEEVLVFVDVNEIPDMNVIEIRDGELFVGASVTHRAIAQSALIQEHAAALTTACGMIGGPQVRNTATIGGNVAHALPAADGAIALMALNAKAQIVSTEGRRHVPIAELYSGPGRNTLDPVREILFGFSLPLTQKGQASAFNRIMRPQGVAIAILNLAVWLNRQDETISEVRIVAGPAGPVPRRMAAAEMILSGKAWASKAIAAAHEAILNEALFRTSRHRATKEYRKDMAAVLLDKTLKEAWAAAGGCI
ncbi:MAG: hypothetical protein B6D68_02730 [spirochete symbiont of Stewartia floridana]|nr:MAG: hypothetical protein B6D68_02730 [spirochete symbiont of Stewartia floridana]